MAPGLLGGWCTEFDSACFELLVSAINIVGHERYVGKGPNSIFVAGRREQNHFGLTPRNA